MPIIDTTTTNTDDGWFCEQGTCYQHPNGNLTYTQCKTTCGLSDYPCSMFAEMCQDYYQVINGTHPSFFSVSPLLDHWVNMYALPTMGGHQFTKPQLFTYIQRCCIENPAVIGGGTSVGITQKQPLVDMSGLRGTPLINRRKPQI